MWILFLYDVTVKMYFHNLHTLSIKFKYYTSRNIFFSDFKPTDIVYVIYIVVSLLKCKLASGLDSWSRLNVGQTIEF
jgi:hypothetical protein